MIEEALVPMRTMMTDSPPEVQLFGYGSTKITYRVKY
jgi:hypothetical protein